MTSCALQVTPIQHPTSKNHKECFILSNKTEGITINITPEMRDTLIDFFLRLDVKTADYILSAPHQGVTFTREEVDVKKQMLLSFIINKLLSA